MKIKIKNPILGVPITIVDKVADDGFIHCTHTSEETINKEFKVEGHEHDLNDEHESVSQLTVNGGGQIQTNPHQVYQMIGMLPEDMKFINKKRVYMRILIQKI